ncbi:MAG: helix-turn-helix transcriptional regulator, partial [Chthoniobacterales bacterium]|nr:helix-turn-helix transcriptional regulator [Chthoniobacterales bacterium]
MPKNKILAEPETPKACATKSCGNALRNVRKSAGITLERLALLTGASESALQKIEHGALVLKAQLAVQIGAVTGCNPDKLMKGKATDYFGQKYSQASFKAWSTNQSPDAIHIARQAADRAAILVRALILCSAGDQRRTTPHQYRGVVVQLSDAIATILETSKLARMPLLSRFNEALEALAEPGDWKILELGDVRSLYGKYPKWKDCDRPTLGDKSMVEVRTTIIPVWNRLAGVVGKKKGK